MIKLNQLLELSFGSIGPFKTYVIYSERINYLVFGLGASETMNFLLIEDLVNKFCEITNFSKESIRFWQIVSPLAFPNHAACLYIFSYTKDDPSQETIEGAKELKSVWK